MGEGTGCPMAFNIIEAALSAMNNMYTFAETVMSSEKLVDIREK